MMINWRSLKKSLECVIFSYTLCLSHLAFSSTTIDPKDKLSHLTGLLLATPGNNEVARNLELLAREMLRKTNRSVETNELLRMSAQALNINKIQNIFDRCIKNKERAKSLSLRIRESAATANLEVDPCRMITQNKDLIGLSELSAKLSRYYEQELKKLAMIEGQKNFAKTYVYWDRRIKHKEAPTSLSDQCLKLHCTNEEKVRLKSTEEEFLKSWSSSEQNKSAEEIATFSHKQDALLKNTKALQDKKTITSADILKAQSEVKNLLEDQLQKIRSMDLEELVKTNPAAIGKILLENPEMTPFICDVVNKIAENEETKETRNKVFVWGGLIVGGTLFLTGVGAGVGAWVLGETALSATLISVATATVVMSSVVSATESIYMGNKYFNDRNEALALRASSISRNGDAETNKETQNKLNEAWSDLTSAGINAVGILPFGRIWGFMQSAAKMSRVGSLINVGKISAKEEALAIKQLSATVKELNNPQLEKILINAQKQVSSEDYGSFIGQLSQLSKEQRDFVISRMISRPDKVAEAMKKGAQAGREACK